MSATAGDGRRVRGDARRMVIIEAALAVLAEVGVSGLTHRAIAARAEVPLASLTYHFDGIDDILGAAIAHATEQYRAVLHDAAWPDGMAGIAALLAYEARERRELLVAAYEMYMLALRQPEHVATATDWLDELTDRFVPDVESARLPALHALIEGIGLHAALRPDQVDVDAIEAMLRTHAG